MNERKLELWKQRRPDIAARYDAELIVAGVTPASHKAVARARKLLRKGKRRQR